MQPETISAARTPLHPAEIERIFAQAPGMCLILDPSFVILAQNDEHCRASMTRREDTVGKLLFEVFPDNPHDTGADGLSGLRRSFITVLKTRAADTIPRLKYDAARPAKKGGGFEPRYWRVVNTPVLDEKGFVRLIVNRIEDVT